MIGLIAALLIMFGIGMALFLSYHHEWKRDYSEFHKRLTKISVRLDRIINIIEAHRGESN